jgi:hypothetical protein
MDDDSWTPPSPAEMRELEEKRRRSDEMSAKMSDMLLRGWKMLNEYCPVSGDVPLMENKQGRKFSVALDKFIDELEVAPEGADGAAGETAAAAAPIAVAPPASPAAAPAAAPSPVAAAPRSPLASVRAPEPPAVATRLTAPHVAAAAVAAGASPLDAALAQVTATLEQCTAQLATSPGTQDAENIVRLMGQSAQTIAQLKVAGAR